LILEDDGEVKIHYGTDDTGVAPAGDQLDDFVNVYDTP